MSSQTSLKRSHHINLSTKLCIVSRPSLFDSNLPHIIAISVTKLICTEGCYINLSLLFTRIGQLTQHRETVCDNWCQATDQIRPGNRSDRVIGSLNAPGVATHKQTNGVLSPETAKQQ